MVTEVTADLENASAPISTTPSGNTTVVSREHLANALFPILAPMESSTLSRKLFSNA